jgi:hypothetical protein
MKSSGLHRIQYTNYETANNVICVCARSTYKQHDKLKVHTLTTTSRIPSWNMTEIFVFFPLEINRLNDYGYFAERLNHLHQRADEQVSTVNSGMSFGSAAMNSEMAHISRYFAF